MVWDGTLGQVFLEVQGKRGATAKSLGGVSWRYGICVINLQTCVYITVYIYIIIHNIYIYMNSFFSTDFFLSHVSFFVDSLNLY